MMITSRKNGIFQQLLKLYSSKGIREESLCLMAGEKITNEYWERIASSPSNTSKETLSPFWVSSPNHQSVPDTPKNLLLSEDLFQELDRAGSHKPLLIVPTPPILSMDSLDPHSPVIYSGLGDPSNTGALIRSAAAFGISQVVLLKESSNPFLPRCLRSSSGYACELTYFKGPSISELQNPDLVGLHMEGALLSEVHLSPHIQFVVGEEGMGLPQNFPGTKISIPMSPSVESLNASVSVGILLFEWRRQHPIQRES